MGDYEKTHKLLHERQDLQLQRKMANMHASLQRQMMTKVRRRGAPGGRSAAVGAPCARLLLVAGVSGTQTHPSVATACSRQAMDNLRFTKDVSSLGGQVNINDLLNKSRPATAM